jgi:uncharacterized membrane protein YphA (DoxX/SURF4 family)
MIHYFWVASDPVVATMLQTQFMKNIAMLSAVFLIAYFGTGTLSIDRNK